MKDALVGRVIASKFEIQAVIGTGAMGVVYRARHIALDKPVAVKVLHQAVARDATSAARLRREAMAASRLDHANSVRIVDFGEEPDGLLYIAMELLDGLDLFRVAERDWPLPYGRVVDLVSQTLSALAVAHELGIVHRDLKPENIMIVTLVDDDARPRDLVKVCDFGIAKIADANDDPRRQPGGPAITMQNAIMGTPEYMSPEQCRGEPTDARSDLYSVGVVLYQLLAGRVPFQATAAIDVLFKHLSEEPRPPTEVRGDVPPELEAVCLKALRKRPEDRYATAREMRAELRLAAEHLQTRAPDLARMSGRLVNPGGTETIPLLGIAKQSSGPGPTALDTVNGTPSVGRSSKTRAQSRARQAALLAVGLALLGVAAIGRPWKTPAVVPTASAVGAAAIAAVTAEPTFAPPETPPLEPTREPPAATPGAHPAATGAPHRVRAAAVTSSIAATSPPVSPAPLEPRTQPIAGPPAPASANPVSGKSIDVAPPPPATHVDAPGRADVTPVAEPTSVTARPSVRRGRVSWSVTSAGGGATTGTVAHALARAGDAWQRCYDAGLSAGASVSEGNATLRLTCDDQGRVVSAAISGLDTGDVATCIRASTAGVTIPNADTGDAWASVAIAFRVIP